MCEHTMIVSGDQNLLLLRAPDGSVRRFAASPGKPVCHECPLDAVRPVLKCAKYCRASYRRDHRDAQWTEVTPQ